MPLYQERFMIKAMLKCPFCWKVIPPRPGTILRANENATLVFLTCPSCHCSQLNLLLDHEVGTTSIGLVTDLTKSDLPLWLNRGPISSDDVLNVHLLLKSKRAVVKLLHRFTHLTV